MPPHLFWDYTHREIHAVLSGAGLAARRQHKLALFGAWHGANLGNAKRLPPLADLLRKLDPVQIMSPNAIRKAVLGIASAMGATVIHRKKKG